MKRITSAAVALVAVALVPITPAAGEPRAAFGRTERAWAVWVSAEARSHVAYLLGVRRRIYGPVPYYFRTRVSVRKVPCEPYGEDLVCSGGKEIRTELDPADFFMNPAVTEADLEFIYGGTTYEVHWTRDQAPIPRIYPWQQQQRAGVAIGQVAWPAKAEGRLFEQGLEPSEGAAFMEAWSGALAGTDYARRVRLPWGDGEVILGPSSSH